MSINGQSNTNTSSSTNTDTAENTLSLLQIARTAKQASLALASSSTQKKDGALLAVKDVLRRSKDALLKANRLDLATAAEQVDQGKLSTSTFKRLDLLGIAPDHVKFQSLIDGLDDVCKLSDPVGGCTLARQLDSGLDLYRVTCPIGVLLVIFEARPEVVIQISALAIKSGNAVILKGGKEAYHSLNALHACVIEGLQKAGLPPHAVQLVNTRSQIQELLQLDQYIDLVIPRGSNALVKHIKSNTCIPVLGHADGICAIYVDKSADPVKAAKVIHDAKTDYPAACNAVETILIHTSTLQSHLPSIITALFASGVTIHADPVTYKVISTMMEGSMETTTLFLPADENTFDTEFLEKALAICAVTSVDEAIAHINLHGSGHTDVIMTEDRETVEQFMQQVDSAGVYWNCSTRFADGFRYGFGAEIGVSTNKTHARGPVGLEGLVIYKYRLYGDGHTAGEYTSGKRIFSHKTIDNVLPPF